MSPTCCLFFFIIKKRVLLDFSWGSSILAIYPSFKKKTRLQIKIQLILGQSMATANGHSYLNGMVGGWSWWGLGSTVPFCVTLWGH
jgi:hypothetical protein